MILTELFKIIIKGRVLMTHYKKTTFRPTIQSKYERNPVKIMFNVTITATKPFEIIEIRTYTFEQTKFLTIMDSFFNMLKQSY